MTDELLDVKAAAAYLTVARSTLYLEVKAGRLPHAHEASDCGSEGYGQPV